MHFVHDSHTGTLRIMAAFICVVSVSVFQGVAAQVYGPGLNSTVTWECPGMDSCDSARVGYPDSIKNDGVTEAIVEHHVVGLPFTYNQPSLPIMTNRGTVIAMYRSTGPFTGEDQGEGNARYMYCSRKPKDSTWSEPILIHEDEELCECPNIFHIPGTDTTLAWYQTDAAFTVERSVQRNYLASGQYAVRISTDDCVTWSEEIMLPAIDRTSEHISDTAYAWLSHTAHRWAYPQRNPLVLMPNGDLAGFPGTAGDYEGAWDNTTHTRSMFIRVPRNNLFHTNPDGDPWTAVPVGTKDQWGNAGGVSHNGDLLVFNPRATKLGMISRINTLSFSDDGGETWTFDGYANGPEADGMPANQGGAVSLDWWDTTSVLNGWHVRFGALHGRNAWGAVATDVSRDSMSESRVWERIIGLNWNYGKCWYDACNGGVEDG